jgi:hypothetical protein
LNSEEIVQFTFGGCLQLPDFMTFVLIIVRQVIKTEVNQFFDNHIAKECLYFMGLTNAANHI